MSLFVSASFKVFLFCFFLVIFQVAFLDEFFTLPINLAFVAILIFAAIAPIYEAILAGLIFTVLLSMLSFDSSVSWFLLPLSFFAVKFNPKLIPDKLLLTLIYILFFTPIVEFINLPQHFSFPLLLHSCLSNIILALPLYFLMRRIFIAKRASFWK